MVTLLDTLLLMPIHQGIKMNINTSVEWETYNYIAVGHGAAPGNKVTFTLDVPRISVSESVDLELFYKRQHWYNGHYETSEITPLIKSSSPADFWINFDSQKGNMLYSEGNPNHVITTYYIEKYNRYIVINLEKINRRERLLGNE